MPTITQTQIRNIASQIQKLGVDIDPAPFWSQADLLFIKNLYKFYLSLNLKNSEEEDKKSSIPLEPENPPEDSQLREKLIQMVVEKLTFLSLSEDNSWFLRKKSRSRYASEFRDGKMVKKYAIPRPQRCKGITKTGRRCLRKMYNSDFCFFCSLKQ